MASLSDCAIYQFYTLFKEDMLKFYMRCNMDIQRQS